MRYPGGKASLYNFFVGLLKHNNLLNCRFVEPYAGGAGLAITLLLMEKVERIVINDADKAIFAFWHALLNETERFIERMWEVDVTIDEWQRQRKIYESHGSDLFELGFAFFFLNRTNRSGILNARPIGGLLQEGKWKIDARFNKERLEQRIRLIGAYSSRIDLYHKDGIELMGRLGSTRQDTVFYVDPPYLVKGSSLYLNHYSQNDHYKLADFLNTNKDLLWVLTYDNVPEIQALYTDRRMTSLHLNYHAARPKGAAELMIFSDSISFAK